MSITGSNGNYTVTVNGSGFGNSPVTLPFTGDTGYFRIADAAQLGHGEYGYTGDAKTLTYQVWTDTEIQVSRLAASSGDALTVALWNPGSALGATWGGNAPPPGGAPQINSVSFSGSGQSLQVTIDGSGFGAAPHAMPFTGDLNFFGFTDFSAHCGSGSSLFEAGNGGWGVKPADGVTLTYTSWTDSEIKITGFSGSYGSGCAAEQAGDPVAIIIWNTADASLTGPQTAWGGRAGISPSIIFTSDQSAILPSVGASCQFSAEVQTSSGQIITSGLTWTSSAPSVVAVDAAGKATAESSPGSATLTVSYPGVPPQTAYVAVAAPAAGTILVPSTDVISNQPGQAVLRADSLTSTIQVGDILVSGPGGGLLAKVTSLQGSGPTITVATTSASLVQAFKQLSIQASGAPVSGTLRSSHRRSYVTFTGPDGIGRTIRIRAPAAGAWICKDTSGNSFSPTWNPPAVDIPITLQPVVDLEGGLLTGVTKFELAVQITVPVDITTGSMTFAVNGSLGFTCTLNFPQIPVPSPLFLGPIEIDPAVTPQAGVTVTAAASGTITVAGPQLNDTLTATDGIEFVNGSWQSVADNSAGAFQVTPAGTTFAGNVKVSVDPFVKASAGFSAQLLGVFSVAGADLVFAQVQGDFGIGISTPLSYSQLGYTGPTWNAGLEVTAGVDVSFTGPVVTLMNFIGISVSGSVTWTPYDEKYPYASSPQLTLTASPSSDSSGPVTLSSTITSNPTADFSGDAVQFWGFKNGSGNASLLAATTVTGGGATASWTPSAADNGDYTVVALLFDTTFGNLGYPYPSPTADVTVNIASPPQVPTVTGVSPGSGPTAGGTQVTITGTNFATGSATTFAFGSGNNATAVNCTSTTSCTATTPAHAAGTVDVIATANGQAGAANPPADQYTYQTPWTRSQPPADTGPLLGASCVGSSCIAVGDNGDLIVSSDSGADWNLVSSATTQRLNSVSCAPGTSSCAAVGANGTIVTGSVAGVAWSAAASPVTTTLNSVTCWSSSSCVAVGDGGTIVVGSPAGGTWNPAPDSTKATTSQLLGVSCNSTICAADGGGTIAQSSDNGLHWTTETFPSGAAPVLTAVSCPAGPTCVAVSGTRNSDAQIIDNTQGTWQVRVPAPQINAALYGISCITATQCIAAGAAPSGSAPTPVVFSTQDGWGSWTSAVSSTAAALLSAAACSSISTCVVVGQDASATTGWIYYATAPFSASMLRTGAHNLPYILTVP